MSKFFTVLVYLLSGIIGLGGSLLHIWTIIIAYNISGPLAAIVSFFLIGLSEFYWVYKAWSISGFDSPYIQWLIVFIVLAAIRFIFAILSAATSKE